MIWKKTTAMKQQFIPTIPSSIGSDWSISSMKINLWYCKDMKQWRWTLTDDSRPIVRQESGQQPFLRDAMNDVANTVEYMMGCKQPE
jgi:hypothetical protein